MSRGKDDSRFWLWLALLLAVGSCCDERRKAERVEAELRALEQAIRADEGR